MKNMKDDIFNGDMDEMKKTLVSMYYLGKINQQHNGKNN